MARRARNGSALLLKVSGIAESTISSENLGPPPGFALIFIDLLPLGMPLGFALNFIFHLHC